MNTLKKPRPFNYQIFSEIDNKTFIAKAWNYKHARTVPPLNKTRERRFPINCKFQHKMEIIRGQTKTTHATKMKPQEDKKNSY